jgi:tetratricopeptide (TPR) repeat protein
MSDQKALIIKLALIYHHTGSWDKALIEYEKILAFDPNDWNTHSSVAEMCSKKGDLDRSYREYDIAVHGFLKDKNTKKAANCFREMAGIIQKSIEPQDQERATQMYQNILMSMPDQIEAIQNLRDLCLRHNNVEEAVKLTLRLGDVFNRQDYVERCENEYMKAISLDATNVEAQQKLETLRNEIKSTKTPGSL